LRSIRSGALSCWAILGLAAGGRLRLFAWRAPTFAPGDVRAVSREGAIVLNNLFVSAATPPSFSGPCIP
jgi:cytochrome c-type biogenesis protein CcmF